MHSVDAKPLKTEMTKLTILNIFDENLAATQCYIGTGGRTLGENGADFSELGCVRTWLFENFV